MLYRLRCTIQLPHPGRHGAHPVHEVPERQQAGVYQHHPRYQDGRDYGQGPGERGRSALRARHRRSADEAVTLDVRAAQVERVGVVRAAKILVRHERHVEAGEFLRVGR